MMHAARKITRKLFVRYGILSAESEPFPNLNKIMHLGSLGILNDKDGHGQEVECHGRCNDFGKAMKIPTEL